MSKAKLTSKGQITVPKAVREALGVRPGDRLAFRTLEDGTVLVEPATVDLRTLRGRLAPARRGVSLAAMEAAIQRARMRGR